MRKFKKDKYIGGGAKRHDFEIFNAFTLAEMMVVMLIVSIVLAAMAPVMTTKNKVDNSSPWRYSPANSSDAYFGAGEAMRAFIGQVNGEDADLGKLIINNNATGNSHILFKSNNDILGDLYLNGTSLILGSRPSNSANATYGANNISIGPNNWSSTGVAGNSNITIGDNSMQALTTGVSNIGIGTTLNALTTGSNNVAVGDNSLKNSNGSFNVAVGANAYQQGTGGSNVIVGGDAMSKYSGNNNVVMGTQAMYYGSGNNNVAIGTNANYNGTNSEATYEGTTAVGHNAQARSLNSTAIGRETIAGTAGSNNYFASAVAIGYKANATGLSSVAIGKEANSPGERAISINGTATESDAIAIRGTATGVTSIAIGDGASSSVWGGIAIGERASSSQMSAIAIGEDAKAAGSESIAIGAGAKANGVGNIAIGWNACEFVTGHNKTCIGNSSGPASGSSLAVNSDKVMFLGDSITTVYIPGNLVVAGNTVLGNNTNSITYIRGPRGNDNGQMTLYSGKKSGSDNVGCVWAEYQWDSTIKTTFENITKLLSDRRLKYVGKENTAGLDKIRQLKVFNYTFKKDTTKTPHVGVIAQDLQKVFPNAVKKGADGFLTIRMEDMFYAVINAIKELDAKYQAQEKRIDDLEKRIEKLEARK